MDEFVLFTFSKDQITVNIRSVYTAESFYEGDTTRFVFSDKNSRKKSIILKLLYDWDTSEKNGW